MNDRRSHHDDQARTLPSRRALLRGVAGLTVLARASAAAAEGATPPVSAHAPADDTIAPFTLHTPQHELDALRFRLAHARWPARETVSDWSQGVPRARLEALVAHWCSAYDFRRCEAKLNAFGQYRTRIDGLGIHFLHVRSPHEDALPLIMTHGWPGSVVEFLKVIEPLTNPTAHGGKAEDAFHVVVPSLPGYGFSDTPDAPGWTLGRTARAWSVLMQRLGYDCYVAQGGDWGGGVTMLLGAARAPGLLGIHLNGPLVLPPPIVGTPSAEEERALAQLEAFDAQGGAYARIQGERPQTLGYGLTDSPIGQAAWIYEKLAEWTDSDRDPERIFTRDEMLDNIMLYWVPATATSSARTYWENNRHDEMRGVKVDIPVGCSVFPKDLVTVPRVWCERTFSQLFYFREVERGGHFAAFEQPALFVRELRDCFRALRAG
ncbi:MAG: epoxide hydrolase family protein [Polyangiales bacterium]